MEKKRVYIQNFTTLKAFDSGKRYNIVTDSKGEELGIEVGGMLTTFDVKNENGTLFTRTSYDKFVDDYFIANSINVPLVLYHNDSDPRTVAGVIRKMTKTKEGVEIVGWIPKSAYYYNLIKSQITEGILQGFSNSGGVVDAEWDEKNNALKITEFALLHASLVATPADTGAMMRVQNTAFVGFEEPIDNEVNNKKEETKTEPWRLLV